MSDLALVLPQLRAMKAQLEALLFLVEMHTGVMQAGLAPVVTPDSCPQCSAPEEKQMKAPSMGGTTITCRECGHTRTAATAPQSVS